MRTLLVRFLVIVVAVFLVSWGLPKLFNMEPPIKYDDWGTLLIFSAILALLNTFIRPILKLLALPITCLTLGLFGIFINVVMFFLAALIEGFLSPSAAPYPVKVFVALLSSGLLAVYFIVLGFPSELRAHETANQDLRHAA